MLSADGVNTGTVEIQQLDGWTDGWIEGRMDGGMDVWMKVCIHGKVVL